MRSKDFSYHLSLQKEAAGTNNIGDRNSGEIYIKIKEGPRSLNRNLQNYKDLYEKPLECDWGAFLQTLGRMLLNFWTEASDMFLSD